MIRNRKSHLFRIGMIDMYHDHQIIICNFSISIKQWLEVPNYLYLNSVVMTVMAGLGKLKSILRWWEFQMRTE
jgi:hypothetical protein